MTTKFSYFIALLLGLFSCKKNQELIVFEGFTQGTTYRIVFEPGETEIQQSEVDTLLRKFDLSLSTYVPNSLISKINRNESYAELDTFFIDMFNKSAEVNRASDGMFDITVAPLVNMYGFGFTTADAHIDSTHVDSLLRLVGMDKVKIENGKLVKLFPEIQIDPNALAQGQAVDVVAEYFVKKGVKNVLVEIGGEVSGKGSKFGKPWTVGVDKPTEGSDAETRELQRKIFIENKALATSGNYRKYIEIDGKKYHHTINPKTGFPSYNSLLSATIIADDCMSADAYATACMVSGLEQAKKIVEANPNLDAYFIYADENGNLQEYFTKGMKKFLES